LRLVVKLALGAALFSSFASATAGGCFYPDYTFTDREPSGGGGASSASTADGGDGAGASTSSAGGSANNGGGGSPPLEDCLDGIDNDDDGNVDCEDPKCAPDYECVVEIPVGWGDFGYIGLYRGTNMPPACPDDMPTEVYAGDAGLTWSNATCSNCGCAPAQGQSCDLTADLDPSKAGQQPLQVANQPCGMSATQLSTLTVPSSWGGGCYHNEVLPGSSTCLGQPCNASVTAAAATVSGGSCNATGGVPNKPNPNFTIHGRACRATKLGKGCPTDQVCLPKPKGGFEPRVCVGQTGDNVCPAPFVTKSVLYDDFDDDRDCTNCACGPASGGTCEMTIELHSDATLNVCTTDVVSVTTGSCANIPGNQAIRGRSYQVTDPPSGGTCSPTTTSTPVGGVTEEGPTTFCCLP
jgi:hypothetical protein